MSANVETLTGYIVQVAKPRKDEEAHKNSKNIPATNEVVEVVNNTDEIEEDDFMEMDEISAVIEGAFQSHARPVACTKVNFRYQGGEMPITGPFLFTDIWWQIEVDVFMSTKNVKHTPRYRIKPEWGSHDVNKYLTACLVPPDKHRVMFTLIKKLLRKPVFSVNEILELTSLEEKIIEGGAKFSCEDGNLYKLVQPYLVKSPITALIRRAAFFPHLFWKLQAILPTRAYGILTYNLSLPKTMIRENNKWSHSGGPGLADLNEALKETPWEFAFSGVLYKKYNLSGCEAKLSDLKKSGIFDDMDDVMKDNIKVYNKLKDYCLKWGHTCINCPGKKNFCRLVRHPCKDRSQTQKFLCSDRIGAVKCEPRSVHSDRPRLFLRRYWEAERNIARNLQTIMYKRAKNDANICLPKLEGDDWEDLDDNQKKAVSYIRTKPLTVLSGMGGCGKTTVVSRLIKTYCNFHMVAGGTKPNQACLESGDHGILLTAPTGKAASSLGKKCGLATAACTIHSVIYRHMARKTFRSQLVNDAAHEDSEPHEEKLRKFAKTKMLVVDECSMVAVTTFNKLLKVLLEETSLCKVVLVGDIRQLPSIEPGNFFEDIFRVASEYDFGVDLTKNHRVDHFAGGRSIEKNAEKISRGKMPKFDEETSGIPKNDDSRFLLLEVPLEETGPYDGRTEGRAREATICKLKELLKSKLTGMEDVTTSQIITFTRNLVKHANNVCAQHYNSRNDKDNRETGKLDFTEGDKICCQKNCLMENPFYDYKVGDSNTGAGFSDGNHLNRVKKDNALSSEEALKVLRNGNQETAMTTDDSVLSSNSGSQFAITPLQQGEKREETEGGIDAQDENLSITEELELKISKIDRKEQAFDEPKQTCLTNDNTYGNEGTCENKGVNANKCDRTLEKDKNLDISDPGVRQGERKSRAHGDDPQPAEIENECEAAINEESYRIYNGDTFIIKKLKDFWDDGTNSRKPAALLHDMESKLMWVDLSAFRRTGKAKHAWCRTIHTFQGSEVKTVVYLISSFKYEFWKHVYTAVTRGKEKVIVIGPKKYLLEALRTNFKRDTGLKGFFQKELQEWQREQMSAMEASREEDASVSAKRNTEMGVLVFPDGGLKNTKVNGHDDSHLYEGRSICTEKGNDVDDKDSLPSVSYQSELVPMQSSQNDRQQTGGMWGCKKLMHSVESTLPTSSSGTKFTELRDSQHRQVSFVEGSPPPPPPPPARIPSREELQKRKIPSEKPKQEVKYAKSQLSQSKEIPHTKRLRQTLLNFPKVSVTPKLLKPTSNNSKHLAVADSLPPTPPPLSVGEDETDIPLESKEFGNQSPMSPMDTGQEVKKWNHSGARKRLKCPSASDPGPTKSAKK